ncbi:cytochrome P450 [Georgenia sp. AZ-5]|uniref:cytochrome P450 n=1 Tax=Georgenia sp. AZ-5 TaxID=3367526 RepID=UPI00375455D2
MRRIVNECIDRFAARGSADLRAELGGVLPRVTFTAVLGPPDDDAWQIKDLSDNIAERATELQAGDVVALMFGVGNHDANRFENPEVFDIDRPRNLHLTFGHGIHRCVGEHLARAGDAHRPRGGAAPHPRLRGQRRHHHAAAQRDEPGPQGSARQLHPSTRR